MSEVLWGQPGHTLRCAAIAWHSQSNNSLWECIQFTYGSGIESIYDMFCSTLGSRADRSSASHVGKAWGSRAACVTCFVPLIAGYANGATHWDWPSECCESEGGSRHRHPFPVNQTNWGHASTSLCCNNMLLNANIPQKTGQVVLLLDTFGNLSCQKALESIQVKEIWSH